MIAKMVAMANLRIIEPETVTGVCVSGSIWLVDTARKGANPYWKHEIFHPKSGKFYGYISEGDYTSMKLTGDDAMKEGEGDRIQ